MKMRMKFSCERVENMGQSTDIRMIAVYHNDDPKHENSIFWKYTPCGTLTFTLDEKYTGPLPVDGKEYYLTIEEVPKG